MERHELLTTTAGPLSKLTRCAVESIGCKSHVCSSRFARKESREGRWVQRMMDERACVCHGYHPCETATIRRGATPMTSIAHKQKKVE